MLASDFVERPLGSRAALDSMVPSRFSSPPPSLNKHSDVRLVGDRRLRPEGAVLAAGGENEHDSEQRKRKPKNSRL